MDAPLAAAGPILVTGAAGFIGAHAVRRLERAGAEVIAGTRDGKGGSRKLDLREQPSFSAALSGIGAVVHCAVGDRAVTVDGTTELLAAAAAAKIRCFVHLSSMAVYGDATGRVDEATPIVPADRDDYGGWKAAAERACVQAAGLHVVRLRPTIVYGAGGAYWLDSMVRRIASGRWSTFGAAGSGTCNLVHVDDVTDAIAAALAGDRAAGHAFNVNGPEAITWNGYFVSLAKAMGRPHLREISPTALKLRMLASLPLKVLAKVQPGLAQGLLQGVPQRSDLGLFARVATYPVDAARDMLGWVPQIGIDEGLAKSAAAWRS